MIHSLVNTEMFNSLTNDIVRPSHAYLFYGQDEVLNIELSKVFATSIFCGKSACFNCESCKRSEISKNPDLLIIDKTNIQVADIEGLIDNVQLKPMIYNYKVVIIAHAEGINEPAQNKLLKTLEEPNSNVVFILACTNIEKLLPTIRSRLNKHHIPNIQLLDIRSDLNCLDVDISKMVNCDITLTDALRFASGQDKDVLRMVESSIYELKSSADIPRIVSEIKLSGEHRTRYLQLLSSAIHCALSGIVGVFATEFITYIKHAYNEQVMGKMIKLINTAMLKINSNVNFNYVLDELFYNILKEKYLCK